MSDFLEVLAFRKKRDGKWATDNLGYAKASDKGGYDLTLFTLPAPNIYEGNAFYRISVRPPRTKQNSARPNNAKPQDSQAPLDDEIPF